MMKRLLFLFVFASIFGQWAWADPQSLRWTGAEDKNADVKHVVNVINGKTGFNLDPSSFLKIEDRDLANNHFRMYSQTASGVPIHSMSIRIWTDLKTGDNIQTEAYVDNPTPILLFANRLASVRGDVRKAFDSQDTMKLVRATLKKEGHDTQIRSVDWRDEWKNADLLRLVRVKGKHGTHHVTISVTKRQVIDHSYQEFPQYDEQSISVQVYPVYEQPEGSSTIQARVPAELRHLRLKVARVSTNPYEPLKNHQYLETKMDPVLGLTPEGKAQGFWAMSEIKEQASQIQSGLPVSSNTFGPGVVLEGRYATISLHPDVVNKFKGLNFNPTESSQFKPDWRPTTVNGQEVLEMIPNGALLGRPLSSLDDAWNRVARRLPDHDPTSYINDGFDEIQVYYAINTLMESLQEMGFTDPELSSRPFNAFLYDPDISMKNNAFYTDDTINFTTYSPTNQNFARDNSTIWHELGHGIMDRLMGDSITLADTGGLSEGMADFVAALVIQKVTDGKPFDGYRNFRIINKTGFNLTNEVHDDGEAYGGTMKDFLDAAVETFGSQQGVTKVTDLTLEAMRLSRDHPALTAQDWFNHMLFADQLGHEGVRAPGELSSLLLKALSGRNYRLDGGTAASFTLMNGKTEVTSKSEGSRGKPILVSIKETDKATYHLTASLKGSNQYSFKYPVQVKVFLRGGPIQGAIHWENEETQPLVYTLNSESDVAAIDLTADGKCDEANRDDGSCVDYAYIQIWNNGETDKPVAKKRFYLRIKTLPFEEGYSYR